MEIERSTNYAIYGVQRLEESVVSPSHQPTWLAVVTIMKSVATCSSYLPVTPNVGTTKPFEKISADKATNKNKRVDVRAAMV